jgi:hypothetical protein
MNFPSETGKLVRLARALFYLNAAAWFIFGALSLLRMADGSSDMSFTLWIVAILMFGNVGAMVLCGAVLVRRQRRFYFLAVGVLMINVVLSVTDEFGVFDLVTMMIDVVLLGLLFAIRKRYLSPSGGASPSRRTIT